MARLEGMEQFLSADAALAVAAQLKQLGQEHRQADRRSGNPQRGQGGHRPEPAGHSQLPRGQARRGAGPVPSGAGAATEEHQYCLEHGPVAAARRCAEPRHGQPAGVPEQSENGGQDARHRSTLRPLSETATQGVWRMNDQETGLDFSMVIASTVHDMKNSLASLIQAHGQWVKD
nr:hypothetical protein [Tanacetum cinerariifolium]